MHMLNCLVCFRHLVVNDVCDATIDREVSLQRHIDGFYFAVGGEDFLDVCLSDILRELFNDDFGGCWARRRGAGIGSGAGGIRGRAGVGASSAAGTVATDW
jgi:hypothetical protein